jgi:hypothetical protein
MTISPSIRAAVQVGEEEAVTTSSNAWPSGERTIGCLACDRRFLSSGRHERLCPACRRRND